MEEHWLILFSLEEQLHSTDLQVKNWQFGKIARQWCGEGWNKRRQIPCVLKQKAEDPSSSCWNSSGIKDKAERQR